MTIFTRKNQKLFAENALNTGQFGSAQLGTDITTSDPDIIQALTAYREGWNDAVVSGEDLPPLEEMQGLQFNTDYQLNYLFQKGIPEWIGAATYYIGDITRPVAGTTLYKSITDNNTNNILTDIANWQLLGDLADLAEGITDWIGAATYYIGSITREVGGTKLYKSITNNNINNILTDIANWQLLGDLADLAAVPTLGTPAGQTSAFAMQTPPTGWLECNGAAISRTTYAALYFAIGSFWGAGNGSTTFNIPDFRGEFLRGWDHGRGVDPGRAFSSFQSDVFQGHDHNLLIHTGSNSTTNLTATNYISRSANIYGLGHPVGNTNNTVSVNNPINNGFNGTPRTASETRPRNVAPMFCIKF